MKAPASWIRSLVDLPADLSTHDLTHRLTLLGLKLEGIEGSGITGPLVVGRVLTMNPEPQKNGKTINWCTVDVGAANGSGEPQGIVCGAHNFKPGDLVVVILPGGVLPGNFAISARKTYGHVSSGMICSARELGLGDDHDGIIVLPADAGEPGQDAFELLGLNDEVIEFEINPDRAYALSLRGIARDAALGFGVPFVDPTERDVPAPDDQGYPIVVEDQVGCPVFAARTVSGFNPAAPTPQWMKRRLEQCGMRSLGLAIDVTNYVMLEFGQPIHGFDRDKLAGPIVVRRAKAGEELTTLDGVRRTLHPEDLLITDDTGPIGLAAVMGGETTELGPTTTNIVIEAAHWEPVSIFRTSRRHKLPSEAAKRFERGVDPTLPPRAADRVAELLVAHGGGTIDPGCTLVGQLPAPATIDFDTTLPARVSGMPIASELAVAHLEAVGCTVRVQGTSATATVPPWRPDMRDPFDLVEEVARVVGYDNVPSVLPVAPPGAGLTASQSLRRRIGRSMAGWGYTEVLTFPWVGVADFEALGLDEQDRRRDVVALANPLSTEQPNFTSTLLPGMLNAVARNLGRGQDTVALFEMASIARPRGQAAPIYGVEARPTAEEFAKLLEALPEQPLHLCFAVTGQVSGSGWWGQGRDASWGDAVQAVRDLADLLGVHVEVEAASTAPWHPGRCAQFTVGDQIIGHAGELHPKVAKGFGISGRTAIAEIDLDVLMTQSQRVRAPHFSNFPLAKEDVALIVDSEVTSQAVESALRDGAGDLLESVRLFDVYTGAQVGEGKKSLAFALRFRAADRTLTDAETAAAREAAVAAAVAQCGAVQR